MPRFWKDQRRFPRFKADVPAIAGLVHEREIIPLRVHCDTISEGGVGARGRGLEPLRVGDLVTMELRIPVSIEPIWVNSIVRYVLTHRRTARCGVEFLSLTEDERSVIKRYCRLQPPKKRWLWF